MNNTIKKFLSLLVLGMAIMSCTAEDEMTNLTLSDTQILTVIEQHKPSKNPNVAVDMKNRLGATHVGGKYYFTDEPYIIEGSKKLSEMGYGVLKLWFNKNVSGYPYHSNWNLPKSFSLKDLASHPYYKTCFNLPFSTIVLSVGGAGVNSTEETLKQEENEIYELTKYLLTEYRNKKVDFVLENWEGDWIMRGGTGNDARWSRQSGNTVKAVDGDRKTVLVPADTLMRISNMKKWFSARQRGVERARKEVSNTVCRVYHAVEANKVMDSMDGIPGIINSVLPQIRVDMVSWSSYDALNTGGLDDGLKLYRGIDYIKSNFVPSNYMNGEKKVFLGEIGIPEQRYANLKDETSIDYNWDTYVGVCLAQNVPYIIQWELYCNEPKDESLRNSIETRKTSEMRGFWLIRPDGTKSYAAKYFDTLLKK